MKPKKVHTKLRIILLLFIYFYHCKSECDNQRELNYVHYKHVHTKTLQTRTGITNGAPMAEKFLKTCLFQPFQSPAPLCGNRCNDTLNCLAHKVGQAPKCELCLKNVINGRDFTEMEKGAPIYVRVDKLEAYIDGMLSQNIKFY